MNGTGLAALNGLTSTKGLPRNKWRRQLFLDQD